MLKNKNAFTVVELLVAFVIFGLLVSIIIIYTKDSIDKAKVAKTLQYAGSLYRSMSDTAVALWDFDEGSGPTVKDTSGNGNDGTLQNGAFFDPNDTPQKQVGAGAGKWAISFDGNDDRVDLSNRINQGFTQLTISAWVKTATRRGLILGRGGMYASSHFFLYINGDGYGTFFANDLNDLIISTTSSIADNKWHFIVFTYNGSVARIYFDAKQENQSVVSDSPSISSGAINSAIGGGLNPAWSGSFNGLLDEVHLYNRALTAFEIQKLYAEGLEEIQLAEK